jgi:type I restriction enzyme S subunit
MSEWKEYKLYEICNKITDGSHYSPVEEEGGYMMASSKDMLENGFDYSNIKRISKIEYDKIVKADCKPQIGDILIIKDGNSYLKYIFSVKKEEEIVLLSSIAILRPNLNTVDSLFLQHYLRSPEKKGEMKNYVSGAAIPRIVLKDFKTLPIKLPPLPIQRRIASILSAYDDLIENNLKRIKLLEELAQRTYEEWFIKFRINGEQLPVDEKTGLPVGWEHIKVENLLTKLKSTKKIPSSEIYINGEIPVIDQSRDFIAGFTNDRTSLINLDRPIIVFGDHTRIFKFVNFPFARGADGTQILLSNNKRMPQHLFYHSLLNVDLSNYHYARHFKFLKDTEITLPTNYFSDKYEFIANDLYSQIYILRRQNQHLKTSRDILLPRLMNGKIKIE